MGGREQKQQLQGRLYSIVTKLVVSGKMEAATTGREQNTRRLSPELPLLSPWSTCLQRLVWVLYCMAVSAITSNERHYIRARGNAFSMMKLTNERFLHLTFLPYLFT